MKNRILAAASTLAMVGLVSAPLAGADPTPSPTPGGYQDHPNPTSCADAWDFHRCAETHGADKGAPPWYLTHSASPGLTEGR
ncbi:Uncharacterised protein [Mycobacteroides abscessus subsp. abscessus]|nr:Uncharacterised protein [Mycobacteroides abscessus]SHY09381.1 Uncharacterised protein [Mycobacteroides abscessus subsp. abscessus]CPS40216.1 Uncharacterised protein [Mycobacteroides abscessus]CPT18145.1 Uncharacterised protein [Mycobacteroides abscessus]CPU38392.1 Uncharacterised protein [Mycobacteroides abscessus]